MSVVTNYIYGTMNCIWKPSLFIGLVSKCMNWFPMDYTTRQGLKRLLGLVIFAALKCDHFGIECDMKFQISNNLGFREGVKKHPEGGAHKMGEDK